MGVDDPDEADEEATLQAAIKHLRPVAEPEPGALEKLFKDHYDQVFRAAYRVTGSYVDAEDVLQTVFLRLARRTEPLDLLPNPAAYLMRAAVNAGLDILRGKTRARSVSIEDSNTEVVESGDAGPEVNHDDRELSKLLHQAVARLGGRSAEMFALRYFEGYGNNEIARLMNTSQLVVGVTLHRSRTRLRKEIGEYLEKHNEKQR
jgi:RNA polymerase sigma-70 factor, ECF subfamily